MGVQNSKEVADTVIAACQQQGTSGRIDSIISDEKFRTQLSSLLAEVPSSFKRFVCSTEKLSEGKAEYGARGTVTHRAFNSLWNSSGPQLDASLEPELWRWYEDPEKVFVRSEDTINLSPGSSHSSFLASVYLFEEEEETIHNVRERLCLTALATVVDKLDGDYLTDSLVEQVADIVDPTRKKGGEAKVLERLKSLLRAASRYRLLAEELGIGELCCLPPDTGDSLWTAHLPKSGKVHDACVRLILDRDIRQLSSTIISPIGSEAVTVSSAAKKVVEFWRMKLDLFGFQYTQPEPHLNTSQLGKDQSSIFRNTSSSAQTRKRKRQWHVLQNDSLKERNPCGSVPHQTPDAISRNSSTSDSRSMRSNRNSMPHTPTRRAITPRNDSQHTLYEGGNASHQKDANSQPIPTNYSLESSVRQPERGLGSQVRAASFIQLAAPQVAILGSRQAEMLISTSTLGPTQREANHNQISTILLSPPSECPIVPAPPEPGATQQKPHFGPRVENDEVMPGILRLGCQSVQRANEPVVEASNNARILARESTTYNDPSVSPILLQSRGPLYQPNMPRPEAADAWLADPSSSGGLFYQPNMQQPEAADAWLADPSSSGGLFYQPMPPPEAADG
ncbi:hypothetical protein BJX99DRAFT_262387 [Aspergillus californicus]